MKNSNVMKVFVTALSLVMVAGSTFFADASVTHAAKKTSAKAQSTNTTVPCDFTAEQNKNADIYAWIQVPGTKINYPILQSETDNYYLNRNVDLSKGYPGCIYTNKVHAKDFSSFFTVLYGHNMNNGSMFGTLHRFDDADFFNSHDTMYVYMPGKKLTYQIYATQRHNDLYLPDEYSASNPNSKQSFVDMSLASTGDSMCHVREGASVTTDDKIIVLATCCGKDANHRFLVFGKLTGEEDAK